MSSASAIRDWAWRRAPVPVRSAAKTAYSLSGRLVPSRRVLPDFVVVGAQRAGTTSLYNGLAGHPDVGRALTKEVRFFDVQYHRGLGWYRSNFPSVASRRRHRDRTGRDLVVGEASPDYLFYPEVPARIAADLPEARLLVVLRDPVDRAYSHYWHQVRRGFEVLPFEEAVAREAERVGDRSEGVGFGAHHFSYLSRGYYADQLAHLFAYVPREQVTVLFSDDLFRDPEPVVSQVCEFLGLRPWAPASFPVLNGMSRGEMGAGVRARLEAHFEPHDLRLASLLGRPLPWRETEPIASRARSERW